MNGATIKTRSSTATETRTLASRFGSRLFEPGESAGRVTGFSVGIGADPSVGPVYLVDSLSGIIALIDYRRQQHPLESDTAEARELDVESEVREFLGDQWRAVASIVSDQEGAEWPEEEFEMVDWDVRIETPPPRPSRRVVVKFQKGSYRPPRIIDDPED
jgi:hypothetical protein